MDDDDDDEIQSFLDQHDLETSPEGAWAETLLPDHIFAFSSPPASPQDSPFQVSSPPTKTPPDEDNLTVDDDIQETMSRNHPSSVPTDEWVQNKRDDEVDGRGGAHTQPPDYHMHLEGPTTSTPVNINHGTPLPGPTASPSPKTLPLDSSPSPGLVPEQLLSTSQSSHDTRMKDVTPEPSHIISHTLVSMAVDNLPVQPVQVPPTRIVSSSTFRRLAPVDDEDVILPAAIHPKTVLIPVPNASFAAPHFAFDPSSSTPPSNFAPSPTQHRHQYSPDYDLPPLKSLPAEFNRKGKLKQQRKREKEREKGESKKEYKEEWFPLGLNRWAATIGANPVYKRVSRATKCLSSKDWAIAFTELRLVRTLERVDHLKNGRWSFRQPKKQRGVGGLAKSHWDYLLDEMKWMRVDFREERKWKFAVAFNLSTAVLEWHACSTMAERIGCGICVQWKRPSPTPEEMSHEVTDLRSDTPMQVDAAKVSYPQATMSSLGLDYGSDDDDDDDEPSKDQSIENSLEPSSLIEDALASVNEIRILESDSQINDSQSIAPKVEESDDTNALHGARDDKDVTMEDPVVEATQDPSASLKVTSQDPILAANPNPLLGSGEQEASHKSTKVSAIYAPLRKQIVYMDDSDLFLDLDKLDLNGSMPTGTDLADGAIPPPPDLSSVFPDLQAYNMLDLAQAIPLGASDGKKRSDKRADRDDPNRRAEDTTYAKLYPASKMMTTRPTLLGSLHPSKHWKDGHWLPFEESPVLPEQDLNSKALEESGNELFDGKSNLAPPPLWLREPRRGQDHPWSPSDDNLLKTLIDRYAFNWPLIADCFNASRTTVPTDRRTALDCSDRWKKRWGPDSRAKPQEVALSPVEIPSVQMTTRGVKRMATVSAINTVSLSAGNESKKRRRHQLLHDTIRRAAKKRTNQQRKSQSLHETHGQYNKLPKCTPAELSRAKAEKEAREAAEIQNARRRQDEHARQLAASRGPQVPGAPQQLPPQPQAQAQQPATVPQQRTPLTPGSVAQLQLRAGQVNISGQQRIATPLNGASRMSPQQMVHTQARLSQTAQAVPSGQPQTPGQAPGLNGTGVSTVMASGFGTRDPTSSPSGLSGQAQANLNSPRPAALSQAAQVPGNAVPRPSGNVNGHYYLPNMPNMQFTQEQMSALRMQMLQASLFTVMTFAEKLTHKNSTSNSSNLMGNNQVQQETPSLSPNPVLLVAA
ncbi:hypothetical protein BDN72DRAFT_852844 [Pluteus cervinus]|uniref:Uncharacterized protein n=1 Tax=Pluteus cervinus TaxID=181527 RepID=A0ACD3BFC8_9AGAR|nr:hypothetical protein BDN72DRAFT_852844 [Pluteus cervinus]